MNWFIRIIRNFQWGQYLDQLPHRAQLKFKKLQEDEQKSVIDTIMRSHEGIVNDYILYIGRALEEGIDVHVIYKAVRRKVEPDALMEMLETGIPSDLTSALVDGLRKDCKKMDKAAVIKIARAVGQRKEITVADEEEVIRRLDYCYDEEGVAVLIDALRKEFRHHKDEEPDSATVAATT